MQPRLAEVRHTPYTRFGNIPLSGKYFSGNWGQADSISATWNSAAYWDVIRAIEIFSCKKPGAFFCIPELMNEIDDDTRSKVMALSKESEKEILKQETNEKDETIVDKK